MILNWTTDAYGYLTENIWYFQKIDECLNKWNKFNIKFCLKFVEFKPLRCLSFHKSELFAKNLFTSWEFCPFWRFKFAQNKKQRISVESCFKKFQRAYQHKLLHWPRLSFRKTKVWRLDNFLVPGRLVTVEETFETFPQSSKKLYIDTKNQVSFEDPTTFITNWAIDEGINARVSVDIWFPRVTVQIVLEASFWVCFKLQVWQC